MKLELFKTLSENEINEIHEAAVDILEHCGVKILSLRMLDFLKHKGLAVDTDSRVVRFSRNAIEDALATIPSKFEVYNQNGDFAFVLGDRITKVAAGHNGVFWADSKNGDVRPATVNDVEIFSRICDKLETIDMVAVPAMPQDVPCPEASLLYGLKAVVENTRKPVYFSTDNPEVNRKCIEILKAAFKGDFHKQVYGITQLSSTSPLFWESGVLDAIMDTVNENVPISVLPEPIAGLSSPYTLAGLVTVNNAECLSGLVMVQMLSPGHNVMYANSWTTADMNSGAALVGSTEAALCRIAGTQLAGFYKIPSHTATPNSDNHAHDEQNAWEKTFGQFCSIGSGVDLVVNCGMFATGLTCSNEQLLMDEEISAMARRIAAGIRVDRETLATELIKRIGPQGATYLTEEHTLNWLRRGEHVKTTLSVCGPLESWKARGRKDTYDIARDKVKDYVAGQFEKLDSQRIKKIDEIVNRFRPV